MDAKTYTVNRSTITVFSGDITKSRAEVIVSSDDGDLSHGGGVSGATWRATGGLPTEEIVKNCPAKVGDVVVTSAPRLQARYILHAITLPSCKRRDPEIDLPNGATVRKAVQRSMELLPLLRCSSIAFPVIGAGVAGVPYEEAAAEMAEVLVRSLLDSPEPRQVELYLYDRFHERTATDLARIFGEHIHRNLGLQVLSGDERTDITPPPGGGTADVGHPLDEVGRKREIYEMLMHLGRRRDQLESDLIAALVATGDVSTDRIASLRQQLEEVARLRHIYQNELGPVPPLTPVALNTVFVSSTYTDLASYRVGLKPVIERIGLRYVGMEDFVPIGHPPGEYIRQRVEASEIYLGGLGMRYGAIDPSSGFSMTELEYRQAVASSKPRLMFVMDEGATVEVKMIERSPEAFAKLMNFRSHVLRAHVCGMFSGLDDLSTKAARALREYVASR